MTSMKPAVREARLRPEFAEQYAGIEAGVWVSAAAMAELLITRLLREGVPEDQLPQRVLHPEHFEFRDGESSGSRMASGR